MPMIEDVLYCDRCGAEVVGAPVLRDGVRYCCGDCADGQPCDCGLVLDDDRRARGEADV
jgi:hypothetical protein